MHITGTGRPHYAMLYLAHLQFLTLSQQQDKLKYLEIDISQSKYSEKYTSSVEMKLVLWHFESLYYRNIEVL